MLCKKVQKQTLYPSVAAGAVAGAVAGVATLPRPAAAAAVGPNAGELPDAMVAGAMPICAVPVQPVLVRVPGGGLQTVPL